MKIERTKNATRNIITGSILKIYTIIVPFLMRTIILYILGAKYLGLDGLFTSILQVLNLTELGVGMAMVNSMYRPIAEDDTDKICALMYLYKKYYRIIGFAILIIGGILTPFIPKLIKGDIPDGLNIYVLYLLNLGATVLTYWLFAYKNSLLTAHQRNDVQSVVTILTNTFRYVLQILVLLFFKSYYLYLISNIISQIAANVLCAVIVDKMYPGYRPTGKLDEADIKKLNSKIRDVFTSKVGAVVVNSADTIVISAFLGLQMLAIYQNYYFILTSIVGVVGIVFSSCTAGIGNSIVSEKKEKNYQDLNKFVFIIAWTSGVCTSCFIGLYQPFMKLWVGENLMLGDFAVLCFCVYYFVYEINAVLSSYKDAAGIWHEDRFRPLVVALANLIMNLIAVNFWGIYGVLLSTVLSTLLVGMPWILHNLFTVLFKKEWLHGFVKNLILYSIATIISTTISGVICKLIPLDGIPGLVVKLIVCAVLPNVLFFVFYRNKKEFAESLDLVDRMTKGHFKKIIDLCRK